MESSSLWSAVAELKANAAQIESETQLECLVQAKDAEIAYLREQNELEVAKAKALSIIEVCGMVMVCVWCDRC